MAFYRADRENDKARDVVRQRRYRIGDFWSSGPADQNFLITGGSRNEQIWGLYYAVYNYLEKKRCPVIILHNNKNLDATFQSEFKARFPEMDYRVFGNQSKGYQPFSGMDKDQIMEILRELCDGMLEVEAYAEAFLNVLSCYETSLSLHNIRRLCGKSDEEILQLAQRALLGQPIGITQNAEGGIRFRRVISNLYSSGKNICSDGINTEKSVTGILKNSSGRQVISIMTGSGNTDMLLKYLSCELISLENREFLTVVYDLGVKEENGLGNLLAKTSAHYTIGLCSEEIYGMFLDRDDKTYQAVRGRIRKNLILRYTDAQAAEKISDIAGCYDKVVRQDITAPTMPFTLIKPRAKGKPKQKYPRIEADEITQMQAEAAILQGHRGHTICFVQRLDYY